MILRNGLMVITVDIFIYIMYNENTTITEVNRLNTAVKIENLNKSFGNVKAVDNLSFRIKEGEFFAFLGVNGAGKSTTINILCGQLKKDSGKVYIDGRDIEKDIDYIRTKIGVVFQNSLLDKPLSVYDNLQSRAALYGITGAEFEKRLVELDQMFDLKEFLKRPVGKLSGGQRRRVDIARALIHRPKILILDEPTTGLDPQTRKKVWDVIMKLRLEEDMTVVLTTHYMEEAADADYIVIIDKGQIAAEGTPHQLKNDYVGDYLILYGVSEEQISAISDNYQKISGGFRVEIADSSVATRMITSHPELFNDYELIKGKMDDVFLNVTGITLEGGQ